MPLREPTPQEVFDQLNSGLNWGSSVITYSFPVTADGLNTRNGEGPGFTAMLASGQVAARLALSLWDDLIIADFQEISLGAGYVSSDLEFGMTTTGPTYAWASSPTTGSIWFNPLYDASSGGINLVSPSIGQHGFVTFIHEIGHALGLEHSGNYNGAGSWSPLNLHDSTVFTVMSYYGPNWRNGEGQVAWADWIGADGVLYSPQTPMLDDIFVIQTIYGAETTTRIENTTYGFNSNITGNVGQIYDFTRNSNPILTIYDSAGIDTLDLSGWSTSSIIDIGQGRFSSCNSMTNNITIAFGCDIENARGGAGNDKIYGNALNNILFGGAGNDELFGLGGDDTIYGGLGSDTVVFTLARSAYQITSFQNYLTVQGSSGTIVLYEIEDLRFSDVTVPASSISESFDTTAPIVSTFSPSDSATGVTLSANIVVTFSEAIARGTGTITLRSGSATGTIVESFDAATSSRLILSGAALTIDPTSNLLAGTQYFVTFSSGTIKDIAGNAYTGTTTYDFTTVADTTAPIVSTFSPSDGATGIALASNVVLTFSETIARGAGTITLRSGSATGTIVESFDAATSSRLILSGAALTIDPTSNLLAGTQYFVTFSSGTIKDIAGNAYTGTTTYDFTTAAAVVADDFPNSADTTGVVTVGGAASTGSIETAGDGDAFKVMLTAGTTYTFALNASSGSLDPYLRLYDPSLTEVGFNDDFGSSRNSQITFTATSTGTYYLLASDFYDTGIGGYTLRGTTAAADTTAPTVSTFTPTDGATGVAVANNVVLTFNEAIARGTGTITLRSGSATGTIVESFDAASSGRLTLSGSTLTIDPTNNLVAGTKYFVVMPSGAVRDVAGNNYAGINTYDFTTAAPDTTAPTVSTFTPTDGATGVAVANNVVLTFNEAITRGTGTITLRSGSATGTIVESFDAASSGRLTLSGSTLTIDPTNNLVAGTKYFVVMPSGAVRDVAGNNYAGTNTYDFTTAAPDTTAPTVSTFTPTDGATGVAVANNVVLTFNETIARGTGTITLRSVSATGTIVESFDAASSGRLTLSGSTLTIDPTNNLVAGTKYFVVMPSGAVRDVAGNNYSGTNTYDFTTAAASATVGNDTLIGTTGTDNINGLAGNDVIDGLAGNDTLRGGTGADRLTGGAGRDTFVFAQGDSGQTVGFDVITDYTKGSTSVGDLIDFSSNLTRGGNANAATATQASINQTTGVATFAAGSGTTLSDALADVATRFTAATDAAGEFAFFKVNNTGNFHMFISDGVAGVTANDVVFEMLNLTSITNINIASGNMTILG